jgi:hypothetical protein
MRRNDLSHVVAVRLTARTRDRTDSPQPSSLRGTSLHRSVELGFSPRYFRPDAQAAAASVLVQWNSVASAHMRCMITAIRRATATTARFIPRCRAIFMPQALSHDHLMVRVIMTWAASNSSLRIIASPHFDMPPIRSISPDWWRRGVKPNTAPTALEFLKRAGTSTVARNANATIGPTPGTLMRRRQTSSWRTIASSRRCRTPSCSRNTLRAINSGSTIAARSG